MKRRNLLKLGAGTIGVGVVGTATLTTGIGSNLVSPEPAIAQNNMTPDEALRKLMAGNKRFVRSRKPLKKISM